MAFPYDVIISVNGMDINASLVGVSSPEDDAQTGLGTDVTSQGRFHVDLPQDTLEELGDVHVDFGDEIILKDGATTTPCIWIARIKGLVPGGPGGNAYLMVEPDHFNEWNVLLTS